MYASRSLSRVNIVLFLASQRRKSITEQKYFETSQNCSLFVQRLWFKAGLRHNFQCEGDKYFSFVSALKKYPVSTKTATQKQHFYAKCENVNFTFNSLRLFMTDPHGFRKKYFRRKQQSLICINFFFARHINLSLFSART